MKKSVIFSLVSLCFISMTILEYGRNKGVVKPDQIGRQAYDIVSAFPSIHVDTYKSKLMSYKQIQELKKISPAGFEKNIAKITQEEWSKDHGEMYNKFKQILTADSKVSDKIKYVDFTFELDSIDGFQMCGGWLKVQRGKGTFSVRTTSIHDGEFYQLVGMTIKKTTSENE